MQVRRAVISLVLGGVVGLAVAGLIGIPRLIGPWDVGSFLSNAFTFWGLLIGSFAAVVAAGVTFAILNRADRRTSRWGRTVAGVSLGVFAAGTIWWIAMWGFSPFTLEGLWIYPLAMAATIGSFLLLRPRGSGAWDEPPAG